MKVLFTTALIESFFEERTNEYLESFKVIKEYFLPDDIKIIECYLKKSKCFLEELKCETFFSETDGDFRNKGVKEALAIRAFIEQCFIDEDEIVIKLTGRYRLTSSYIIDEIVRNPDIDSFVRSGTGPQYFTGFFAMRFRNFKSFFQGLDLNNMEGNSINIETELFNFIQNNNFNNKVYDRIDVYSNINNTDKVKW